MYVEISIVSTTTKPPLRIGAVELNATYAG